MNVILSSVLSVLLVVTVFSLAISLETAVIQTGSGKVQGEVYTTAVPGKRVQVFTNIPYAEAPVGKLRFAKPKPKKPWNGTLKYSNMSIACWQKLNNSKVKMTEDCLILNIWTPYPQKTNQSVMVWIHGGGFIIGQASYYVGHNLVTIGDIILVTINYRVSILGFLTSADSRLKGNYGLFDQRLAMKWVKENIANFGGDPESITIFGESAGAASVSAHTLSKKSWPYFQRAILQSGDMNSPWATSSKKDTNAVLKKFLNSVDCANNGKLLECLQNNVTKEDFEDMYVTTPIDFDYRGLNPSVDGDFFTAHPSVLLKNGTVKQTATMLGVTKHEGFLFDIPQLLKKTRNVNALNTAFEHVLGVYFKNASKAVYDEARGLYQPKCFPSFVEAVRPLVDFNSDVTFICSIVNDVIVRSNYYPSTNFYVYRYSYATPVFGAFIIYRDFYPQGTFGFAAHGLELEQLFGGTVNNPIYPAEDQILAMRMILYWTNFAKNGDPNVGVKKLPIVIDGINNLPNWPKFMNSTRKYLDMESNSRMTVRTRMREKHCGFLSDPKAFVENETVATTVRSPSLAVKHIARMELLLFVFLKVFF